MNDRPVVFAIASRDGVHLQELDSLSDLNAMCRGLDQNVLVIAPDEDALKQLAVEEFDHWKQTSIGLHPLSDSSDFADDWTKLPQTVAVRVTAPESAAVIVAPMRVLRDAGATEPPFRDVPCPIWDWLIRQVDEENEVPISRPLNRPTASTAHLPRPRLVPLPVEKNRRWILPHLLSNHLISQPHSAADAVAVRAGLLQIHDFMDESHRQSQSVEGEGRHASADYWHGIMHRREPDYGNSKYWFRRVGPHPVFDTLAKRAEEILRKCETSEAERWQTQLVTSSGWNPYAFIDFCEACAVDEESPLSIAAREIQWQEMRLLLYSTCQDAMGL